MGRPCPAQTIRITSCSAKVGEERRVIRGAGFCGKRTVWPFMQEYAAGLKAPEDLHLRIDTTGCAQAIATSSVIERSARAGGYN